MYNGIIKVLMILVLLLSLISCNKIKLTRTPLPISHTVPVMIEKNDEETQDLNLLESGGQEYLFYSVIDNNQGLADIRFTEVSKIDPLKFSEVKTILPKSKYKQRHLSSILTIDGITWLYYVEGDSLKDIAKSYRAQFNKGHLSHTEELAIDNSLRVIHWQKFHVLPNNNVTMVYRNGKGMFFGTSKDGKTFTNFIKVYERGAKPYLVALDDETLIYSFQGIGKRKGTMQSKFSYSIDGGNKWSQATNTTESYGNVHDAFLIERNDGLTDIYYIYPIGTWRGFSLFRRCIKSDFTLGVEEQVIEKEIGHLMKPNIFRINKQQLLLTFVEANSNYSPFATVISGDSVCQ